MPNGLVWRWLVRGMLIAAAPLMLGGSPMNPGREQRLLDAHNRERALLGLPPLRWSAALADAARGWADHLGQTGAFEHSPEDPAAPEGENLWAGTKGYFAPEAMVGAWIAEKRDFKPGVFPNNSRSGELAHVGHYTQLIWRETDRVGCAVAQSASEDVLVCRYSQAGNVIGQSPL